MAGTTAWSSLFGDFVDVADEPMAALLRSEERRQEATINLIASESYCPRATIAAEASLLVNKNASGYPGRREVSGCEVIDDIERLAVARAKALFGAEHANVQALASTVANVGVLRALLKPRDRILALDTEAGGHHSHGASYHLSGQDYEVIRFGVDGESGAIDLVELERLAERVRPRLLIAGSTAYPRALDFRGLRKVATAVEAMLFADIAHVAGLVVAGMHENPAPYADVVTTSTHKTLCGPRTGGVILSQNRFARAIDAAIFPGIQGAPGAHIIAGRAVLFELVGREPFRELMGAVLRNAEAVAQVLAGHGLALYTGGTDTHMVVVDLRATDWDGSRAARVLERHGILANGVTLPARDGRRRSGLRLGTTAMTIRGMEESAMRRVGRALAVVLAAGPDRAVIPEVEREVAALAAAHPLPWR